MRLRVEAEVRETEDQAKVARAIGKIFPLLKLSREEEKLVGESERVECLDRLHQLLRLRAILDSARKVMREGVRGDSTTFMLHKQAAFVGRVSFAEEGESPLGPIVVRLEAPDIERLIDYLAPKTVKGKPVREIAYEESR